MINKIKLNNEETITSLEKYNKEKNTLNAD